MARIAPLTVCAAIAGVWPLEVISAIDPRTAAMLTWKLEAMGITVESEPPSSWNVVRPEAVAEAPMSILCLARDPGRLYAFLSLGRGSGGVGRPAWDRLPPPPSTRRP